MHIPSDVQKIALVANHITKGCFPNKSRLACDHYPLLNITTCLCLMLIFSKLFSVQFSTYRSGFCYT